MKFFTMAKPLITIICRELNHRQKLFLVGLAIGSNYLPHAESSEKNAQHAQCAISLFDKNFPAGCVISKIIYRLLRDS